MEADEELQVSALRILTKAGGNLQARSAAARHRGRARRARSSQVHGWDLVWRLAARET